MMLSYQPELVEILMLLLCRVLSHQVDIPQEMILAVFFEFGLSYQKYQKYQNHHCLYSEIRDLSDLNDLIHFQ